MDHAHEHGIHMQVDPADGELLPGIALGPAHGQFFRRFGFLVMRELLTAAELAALRADAALLIEKAVAGEADEDFYRLAVDEGASAPAVPFRVEYVLDKSMAARRVLGHPHLLSSIERLQGERFIPTWDSLVFKLAGAGVGHPWHRDAAPYDTEDVDTAVAAIDVGIYLDDSNLDNCLWVLPGSNTWSADRADALMDELGDEDFRPERSAPVPVRAGDAIFHNIMTIHGSRRTRGPERRVVYFEFRQIAAELAHGPHSEDYIPLKLHLLSRCRALYREAASDETAASVRGVEGAVDPSTAWRFPHDRYWRYKRPFRS